MAAVSLRLQPDFDCNWAVSPGALTECYGFIPMRRGSYASWACDANSEVAGYTSAVEPTAGGIIRKADGTARFFLFNKQSIYEFDSTTTATNRSAATYSASTVAWTWAQFGDTTIATNLLDNVQASTSAAFAALAGSPPKAQLVAVNLGFVMLANIATATAIPDGWACSDLEDPTDWTITATNQADTGRLYDTPGPIRALLAMRDTFVAYKDDSIYVADYVGDPSTTIWSWRLISDRVGCSAPHGVAVANGLHYFTHRTGFYVFDGASVRQIGAELGATILTTFASVGALAYCQATTDQRENNVFFCFPAGSVYNKLVNLVAYNIETGKWGQVIGTDLFTNLSGAGDYATGVVQCSFSDLLAFRGSVLSSVRSVVLVGLDGGTRVVAQYGNYPANRQNEANHGPIRTGALGDGITMTNIQAVRPRLYTYTASVSNPTCTIEYEKVEAALLAGSGDTVTAAWTTTEHQFNANATGRFMRLEMYFNGAVEIAGIEIDGKYAGKK